MLRVTECNSFAIKIAVNLYNRAWRYRQPLWSWGRVAAIGNTPSVFAFPFCCSIRLL